MRITSGTSDQYVNFVAVDATDLATRETGLTGFTVIRSRNGGTAASMSPTTVELSAASMPGVYGLLLDEDTTIGTDNVTEEIAFHITHASMAPVTRTIELFEPTKSAIISELAQGAPASAPSLEAAMSLLYGALRNKVDVTATIKEYHNDAGTIIWTKALSDDGTTFTEAEGISGA